jgi:hypothetical protein
MKAPGSLSTRSVLTTTLAAVVAAVFIGYLVRRENGATHLSYPPLVIPATVPSRTAGLLRDLHAEYSAVAESSGVAAMRDRIKSDIRRHEGRNDRLDVLLSWISRAAWNDAADLCLDIAEIGDTDVRRSCAAELAATPTALVTFATHGSRIAQFEAAETDGGAKSYWGILLARLKE